MRFSSRFLPISSQNGVQSEDAYQTAMNEFVNYAKRRPMLLLGYFKGVDMDNGGKEFSKSQIKLSDEEMQKYFGDAIAKIQQDQQ